MDKGEKDYKELNKMGKEWDREEKQLELAGANSGFFYIYNPESLINKITEIYNLLHKYKLKIVEKFV